MKKITKFTFLLIIFEIISISNSFSNEIKFSQEISEYNIIIKYVGIQNFLNTYNLIVQKKGHTIFEKKSIIETLEIISNWNSYISYGDIDGDNKTDLSINNLGGSSGNHSIYILKLGKTFQYIDDFSLFSTKNKIHNAYLKDVNSDGIYEVVAGEPVRIFVPNLNSNSQFDYIRPYIIFSYKNGKFSINKSLMNKKVSEKEYQKILKNIRNKNNPEIFWRQVVEFYYSGNSNLGKKLYKEGCNKSSWCNKSQYLSNFIKYQFKQSLYYKYE